MENIAFDSHKRYTFCSVENADGVIVEDCLDSTAGFAGQTRFATDADVSCCRAQPFEEPYSRHPG